MGKNWEESLQFFDSEFKITWRNLWFSLILIKSKIEINTNKFKISHLSQYKTSQLRRPFSLSYCPIADMERTFFHFRLNTALFTHFQKKIKSVKKKKNHFFKDKPYKSIFDGLESCYRIIRFLSEFINYCSLCAENIRYID